MTLAILLFLHTEPKHQCSHHDSNKVQDSVSRFLDKRGERKVYRDSHRGRDQPTSSILFGKDSCIDHLIVVVQSISNMFRFSQRHFLTIIKLLKKKVKERRKGRGGKNEDIRRGQAEMK